jgi:hypothetical protein
MPTATIPRSDDMDADPGHTRTTPEMQPEAMSLEMIKRITAAISDLESFRI